MEKKIKFEDIVAFIKKAMDKDYDINMEYYKRDGIIGAFNSVNIRKKISEDLYKDKKFKWNIRDNNKLSIVIDGNFIIQYSNYVIEVENRKDILKWETLMEEVVDYTHRKLEENFENFFKEEHSSIRDINDLDDKDDDTIFE